MYIEPHLREHDKLPPEERPEASNADAIGKLTDLVLNDILGGLPKYEGPMDWVDIINYDANPGLERPRG